MARNIGPLLQKPRGGGSGRRLKQWDFGHRLRVTDFFLPCPPLLLSIGPHRRCTPPMCAVCALSLPPFLPTTRARVAVFHGHTALHHDGLPLSPTPSLSPTAAITHCCRRLLLLSPAAAVAHCRCSPLRSSSPGLTIVTNSPCRHPLPSSSSSTSVLTTGVYCHRKSPKRWQPSKHIAQTSSTP